MAFSQGIGWGIGKHARRAIEKAFVFTVDTTLGDGLDNYTLNFTGAGYDIKTSDGQTITGATAATTINFPGPGTYDIKIRGDVSTRTFANDLKLVDIKNWGVLDTPLDDKFVGANSLTTITAPDQPVISSMTRLFNNAQNFAGGISHWDVSNIVSFQRAFYNTSFDEDISSWDTSSANTFYQMFWGTPFNNDGQPGIGNWDVSNVADFLGCFTGTPFNQPIGSWNIKTSGPVRMDYMFSQATSFNQDLSTWDVSSVTIMTRMFNYASSFNGDVSNWDVSGVADLGFMFERASNFNHPGIGSWNTSGATSMASMFDGVNGGMAFNQDISGWDVSNVLQMNNMFRGCYSLNQPFNSWNTSSLTSIPQVFFNCYSFNQPLNLWNTSNVTQMQNVFYGATAFNQDISSWDITKVTIFNDFFTTTAFSTDNYDAVLVSWENQLQVAYPAGAGYIPTIAIKFGATKYTLGGEAEAARTSLINTYGWTITDGGGIAAPVVPFTTNLVASYNFDTNFTDYTGNHPLTSSGNVTAGTAGGVVSNCSDFGGTLSDFLEALDSDDFSFTDGVSDLPFSVSMWLNFDVVANSWFFDKRGTSPNDEYQITYYLGSFAIALASQGGYAAYLNATYAITPVVGTWYHLTWTYDGSGTFAGIKLYIDGVSQALTNISVGTYVGMSNGTAVARFGKFTDGSPFNGKMDETHIWKNRKLTAAEVTDIYTTELAGNSILPVPPAVPFTTNLVASYNFDADFTDYTGNHPLTPSGSTPPVAGVSGGVVNSCAEFNSTADYTLTADSDDFSFTDGVSDLPFSFSFWANFAGYNSSTGVWFFSKRGDSTNVEWQILNNQNAFAVTLFSSGSNSSFLGVSLSYPPPIGSWHHYAVTYDGSETFAGIKLYIDGVSQTLTNTSVGTYTGMVNGTQDLNIGSRSWQPSAGSFWGKMDETHVWKNRELTSAEVSNIYTTELAGNSILPVPFTTNLVASYNFDADLTDYTGNNNGTTPGTITHSPFKVNNGAYFSGGVNDYVALPNTSDTFTFHNGAGSDIPFSISFWIDDLDGSNNNDCYFWVGNDVSTRSVDIARGGTDIIARCYTNTNNRLEYTYFIGSAVVPVHFCMTYDGSKTPSGLKFYVNGVDAAGTSTQVGTFTGINPISQMQTRVGTIANFSSYEYEGQMDELHVWKDRVLTAFEVSYVYDTENAGNSILP